MKGEPNFVADYKSYMQFQSDLAGSLPVAGYNWVTYDPEAWSYTPTSEQDNPIQAMTSFVSLAHACGYKVILTPGMDFMSIAPPAGILNSIYYFLSNIILVRKSN
jgi:hypothetical protein